MKTSTLSFLTIPVAALAMMLSGCSESRTWGEDLTPVDESKRVVLFAPVDAAPLAEDYPDADLSYARELSSSLETKYQNIQAWVGETLPLSSSERWSDGVVGSTTGANLIVLTEVLSLDERTIGTTDYMVATVRMRALDASGEQVYINELEGRAINQPIVKLMRPESQPPAKAVDAAASKLVNGLGTWVEGMSLMQKDWQQSAREEAPLIDVTIDSMPPGADIYVDGAFRGTTPMQVPLPARELTLRVQRQGYQVWEANLTPTVNMNLAPGLEPLPGSEPAE